MSNPSTEKSLLKARAYIKKGDLKAAAALYKDILRRFPNNQRARRGLQDLTKSAAQLSRPNTSARKIDELIVLYENRNYAQAVRVGEKIVKKFPNEHAVWNVLGASYRQLGRYDDAVEAFSIVTRLNPTNPVGYNNLGNSFLAMNNAKDAMASYHQAVKIDRTYTNAWVNGASALEKANMLDELEQWIEEATLAYDIVPTDIRVMEAAAFMRRGDFERAYETIANIEAKYVSKARVKTYYALKAKCLEKKENFDEAFACYEALNAETFASEEFRRQDPDGYFDDVKNRLRQVKAAPRPGSIAGSESSQTNEPIFMVGFPRSGTTLLDTILRSHSKLDVVEEKPALTVVRRFLKENGWCQFSEKPLPVELRKKARKVYLGKLSEFAGAASSEKRLIDKLPLNMLHAPLIYRIFPNAKFVFSVRHPMGSIFSNWTQDYGLNPAMANMVDLDRAADFYCCTMDLFSVCRKMYNLHVHEIRYEDLVEDFKHQAVRVLDFLGMEWEDNLSDYQHTALKRGLINTPSYSQVVQPIYKSSKHNWMNYERHLARQLEKVDHWTKEFGYGPHT